MNIHPFLSAVQPEIELFIAIAPLIAIITGIFFPKFGDIFVGRLMNGSLEKQKLALNSELESHKQSLQREIELLKSDLASKVAVSVEDHKRILQQEIEILKSDLTGRMTISVDACRQIRDQSISLSALITSYSRQLSNNNERNIDLAREIINNLDVCHIVIREITKQTSEYLGEYLEEFSWDDSNVSECILESFTDLKRMLNEIESNPYDFFKNYLNQNPTES